MDDRWMQACALGAGRLGRWEAPEGQGTRGPGSTGLALHPAGHPSSAGRGVKRLQRPRMWGWLRKVTLLTFTASMAC